MDEDLPEDSRRNVQQYELVGESMPVQFSSSGTKALNNADSLVRESEIRAPSGRTRDLLLAAKCQAIKSSTLHSPHPLSSQTGVNHSLSAHRTERCTCITDCHVQKATLAADALTVYEMACIGQLR